jgi:hypothetical protein
MTFAKWLETFVTEKDLDVEQVFAVEGKSGTNHIPLGCVLEAIYAAPYSEQASLKNMIVKIDFLNGDVCHYFKHLRRPSRSKFQRGENALPSDLQLGTKQMIKQFQIGRTYATRSACDHDCIFSFAIIDRTEKTVKIDYHGKVSSKKIRIRDGVEAILPLGSYSMGPFLTAEDTSEKIEAQIQRAAELATQRAEAARARISGFMGT